LDLRFVFLLENAWTDSTSSWTGGALSSPWTRAIATLGASPELGLGPLWGSRSPAKGVGRRGRGWGNIWQPHLAPTGGDEVARRRGVTAARARRWGCARGAGRGRGGAGEGWHGSGILRVLYIGQGDEVRGRGRKSGGRRWVFSTGCFETEKEREGRCSGTD
jgi:hypothetical protein